MVKTRALGGLQRSIKILHMQEEVNPADMCGAKRDKHDAPASKAALCKWIENKERTEKQACSFFSFLFLFFFFKEFQKWKASLIGICSAL